MSVQSSLLDGRHRKRLLFILLLVSLTGLFFFLLANQHQSRSLLANDTDAVEDEGIESTDSAVVKEKDYPGGWLEPEWEWARDVSIVYTWVNGSDPVHLANKAKVGGQPIAHEDKRDRTFDELRYSLRSVLAHMPWHRGKIFIVTPNQWPSWLSKEQDRVVVVNQADILPAEVGTTFNSFLIEFYLDQIPGVHDYMIQLNDDYFFSRYAHPRFFFTSDGRLRFFRTDNLWNIDRRTSDEHLARINAHSSWDEKLLQALRHTGASIKEVFDDPDATFYWLEHAPYVWTKWSFSAVRMTFQHYLTEMYGHKFRDPNDLVPTIVHQAYIKRLAEGNAAFSVDEANGDQRSLYRFGQLLDNTNLNRIMFNTFRTRRYIMFNINDDLTTNAGPEPGEQFSAFLAEMYPYPSAVEK